MTTPTDRILSELANHGCDPRRNGNGWSARCPAHDDRHPSLSVSEGDDGCVLVHCHADCSVDHVCGALGIRVSDLMADGDTAVDTTAKTFRKNAVPSTSTGSEDFQNAEEAIAALQRKHGKPSATWTYRDAKGDAVGKVLRWETSSGKIIRPVARVEGRWRIGGMPEPRPLYCLPDLPGAGRVFITEGEKAAGAARHIALMATTSAHGAQSADKTDWKPLAGKECIILPDHDEPGRKYAETVAAILATLTPAPVVKVVQLPDLPDHGDIADWVKGRPDAGAGELRQELEDLANEAEPIQPAQPAACIGRFRPFPVDGLPQPIRRFVESGAKAIGCDPSYLALPVLTVLAAAIGNTRRIQLKRGWTEPPILWTAIVGDSGSKKSPALELALKPVRQKQEKALLEYTERAAAYEDDLLRYQRDLNHWKKKSNNERPPEKPASPVAERFHCDDSTIEALADLLQNQRRGLLVAKDELAGWIQGFDRYTQRGGGDVARWLEVFHGRSLLIDRKSGQQRTVCVPRAAVSVTGGIQPEVLRRSLGREHRENGLAARLLLAFPPRRAKRWTESDIDPQFEHQVAGVVNRLYELSPGIDKDGAPDPVVIGLTPGAKREWVNFYNQHADDQAELSGDLAAAWSKLEAYAARLALVIHFARWAENDVTLAQADAVDEMSMKAAIQLTRWFANEARRVYSILDEDDESRELRRLAELVERKGGRVTPRDIMRSSQRWRTACEVEGALNDLFKAGYGQWVNSPTSSKGGRPTRVFVLYDTTDVDTTATKSGESDGCVNVDDVEPSEDEWGEL